MAQPDGSETDGELYKLAADGSREAARMIVERHTTNLTAYLRSRTDARTAADDAVAETWLKFFNHLRQVQVEPTKRLRKPESIRFWLFTTARNALMTQFRHQARQRDLEAKATDEARALGLVSSGPVDLLDDDLASRREALRTALQALSDICRELLTLLAADPPLSYKEVADLTGRPVGAIGPTRQRCLNSLRAQLGVTS